MTLTKVQKNLLTKKGYGSGIANSIMDKYSNKTFTALVEKGLIQGKITDDGTLYSEYKFTVKGKEIASALYDKQRALYQKKLSKPLKVEKGIPVPDIHPNPSSVVRDALSKMSVGDSFTCSYDHLLRIYAIAPKLGIKTKSIGLHLLNETSSNETHSYRVWRVA